MYTLTPALQPYDWGTTDVIAGLLGIEPTGGPVAEAWWGAHPDAPALAHTPEGPIPLTDLVAADALGTLGEEVSEQWGTALPYLVKVLSVAKPLSIQVHPSAAQAQAGFDRERGDHHRSDRARYEFADRSAKPEMVIALTPMVLLAGFRPLEDLERDLALIGGGAASDLVARSVESYLRAVLALPRHAAVLADMTRAADHREASRELRAAADASLHHPGDPGALIALALNCVELSPGEALFIDAGVVHSYQTGTGLEVMANSDNVIRAGLTSKPVNSELFLQLADLSVRAPLVVSPTVHGAARVFTPPAVEYGLTLVSGGSVTSSSGPRMVVALAGDVHVESASWSATLRQGQAGLVPHSDGNVTVTASELAAVAWVPSQRGG